ncbi:MAG: O-Antigen ligase [Microgenomates bacterium OLB22]|nr:MAG: O-Antigen ligase [Microgenomates bacterium OLB22]
MYIGWDEHAGRLFGSFFDAHIAGVVYGLSLVGLYLLSKKSEEGKESKRSEGSESSKVSEKSKKSWERVLLGVGITLAGGALVLSFSRLAWVSVAAAFFYAWSSWKVRLWGIVVGIILFGFLIMFNPVKLGSEATHLLRTSTVSSRFVDIQKGITLGLQYPLVGVGYNRLPFYKKSQESAKPFEVIEHHASGGYPSVLVTIFVTGGIIGLLLFLRLCWWLWSISNDEQHLILSLVFIASLFESTLLIPIIISYTALLWWMVKEVKSEKS